MPPTQRFNASQGLLELASRVGQSRNFDKRFAQEQALVSGVRARQIQEQALRLERDKLAQQASLAQRTPTQGRSFSTPFTQSTQQANAIFKGGANALNLDAATQEALSIAERNNDKQTVQAILDQALQMNRARNTTQGTGEVGGGETQFTIDSNGNLVGTEGGQQLPPDELKRRGGFVGPSRQAPINLEQQSKQGFLDNLQLPPESKAALQSLVNDPSITVKDFAIRASALRSAGSATELTRSQTTGFERDLSRDRIKDLDSESRAIEERLRSEFQVETVGRTPADLLTQFQGSPGIPNNIGFNIPFTGTAAKPEAQQLFQRLVQLRAEKDRLRSQQESSISGDLGAFQQPQVQDDLESIGTNELLRELLGE
jgi:hypothetical protein